MAKSKNKKWIENAADEYVQSYDFLVKGEKDSLINFTKEVCKKILEEVEHNVEVSSETTEGFVIGRSQLKDIIEDLGVEL